MTPRSLSKITKTREDCMATYDPNCTARTVHVRTCTCACASVHVHVRLLRGACSVLVNTPCRTDTTTRAAPLSSAAFPVWRRVVDAYKQSGARGRRRSGTARPGRGQAKVRLACRPRTTPCLSTHALRVPCAQVWRRERWRARGRQPIGRGGGGCAFQLRQGAHHH